MQLRQGGFTLSELIVVIVVVGILAGVAAPRFLANESIDVPVHAERLRALLRYGQRIAIAQNRPVYVDITSNRVALCFDDDCTSKVLGPQRSNSGTTATTSHCASSDWACEGTPTGISQSGNSAEFSFDALGRPFADADNVATNTSTFSTLTIQVSSNGNAANVVVETGTGYVH